MVYEKRLKNMVAGLKNMGIKDESVLQAMSKVPRHKFISEAFEFQAYDEKALPIGYGQTISHPYTVAKMTELLQLKSDEKVLEIGTGSGYQAAILSAMNARVFSIEIKRPLAEKAKVVLAELGYQAALRIGDGRNGWAAYAPYHHILVTAGAPVVPEKLLQQLKRGGKLLIPIGTKQLQKLTVYEKKGKDINHYETEEFRFVPLTGK